MFQLDDNFLNDIGLGHLPEEQKKPFLQHIYNELELRVGTKLSDGLTEDQLYEFEKIIDRDDAFIMLWLIKTVPDFTSDEKFKKLQADTGLDVNDTNLRAEYSATKWLEVNRPDYKNVVMEVISGIKEEIIKNKDVILGDNN